MQSILPLSMSNIPYLLMFLHDLFNFAVIMNCSPFKNYLQYGKLISI
uniref:Uncharacterized protein n=1 Tax=Rhizophora mucronata TaxID=61149 RepID=A0A2P2N008_RHIMU